VPEVYLPLARLRYWGAEFPVSKRTNIVIEGFPRSGNTFAVEAFRQAQSGEVVIAHHLHSMSQIKIGIKYRLPVIVLVRNPADAVLSLMIRDKRRSVVPGLNLYVRFYKNCLPYREKILIASFEQVTTNFDLVIRRLNKKFATKFNGFDHSDANLEKVFEYIENRNRRLYGGGHIDERTIARPSAAREKIKEDQRTEMTRVSGSPLFVEAEELYYEYLELSDENK
jgi:hypothetical protein